ncbi:Trk system potassium uptake protein TrkG [Anaplasma phagocytophilum]|uniref:TrkH family potassium uptake protein n=1 Tax=Anaplasma phagocytophilum TaxID=948 RepID=UPI0007E1D4A5|nr:TrkH family potassium uptake protein [Anaplasma phagocytophilum]SCV65103.1 Trk system potassium uptake protein TrkG [Anaplasma phagocytophilum]
MKVRKSGLCVGSVAFITGMFTALMAAFLLIPMTVSFLTGSTDWVGFAGAFAIASSAGILCILNGKRPRSIRGTEAIYLTCSVWIALTLVAAVPFVLADTTKLSYVGAVFEAMSGLTTTGATVMSNLSQKSHGVLLWRAMLNAMGGLGVITIGIFLLPNLKMAGLREIYNTEALGRECKSGVVRTVLYVTAIYILLMILCYASYRIVGMSMFDAICHAMTTVSTGGFSNYDDSLKHFDNVKIEIVAIVFMLLSSCPFVAYIHIVFERRFKNSQFLLYMGILTVSVLLSTVQFQSYANTDGYWSAFRFTVFTVVSLSTSTGYSIGDFSGCSFMVILVTMLTLCGGCAGSTNSGLKVLRLQILAISAYDNIRNILLRGCSETKNTHIPDNVRNEAGYILFLYLFVFILACLCTSWMGYDLTTAITAVSSTLSNTGIGVGAVVGPEGDFSLLTAGTKLLLTALMLLGRLEIVPVMVLLSTMLRIGIHRVKSMQAACEKT